MAIDLGPEQNPAPEGMCVTIFDPTNAVSGGTPDTLAQTTLAADGSYGADLPTNGEPLLVVIDDCNDTTSPSVFPTGTPVPPDVSQGAQAGDTVNVTSVSVSTSTYDVISAGLTAAGDTTDVATDGMLIGLILDGTTQTPLEDGTLSCGGCTVYYGDQDPSDGLFSTAGTLNTQGGGAVVPAAPISTYAAVADGYTFQSGVGGAIPHGALVAVFLGTASQ